MNPVGSGLLRGAAAGAAGTTTLSATTYLDTAVRGDNLGGDPGGPVAALTGTATGVGLGSLAGALRAAGVRLPTVIGGPLLGLAAMAASDGPLAVLRIGDLRRGGAAGLLADAVPHLVYGVATHAALVMVSRVAETREPVPVTSAGALLRAAAVGAASGSRSTAGVTALAATSTSESPGRVASRLGGRTGTVLSGLAAAGELVADKLPATPSRLNPTGLAPRAALGATSAAALARRDGDDPVLAGLVGLAAATAAAVLGVRWRAAAQRRWGTDRPGALLEDAAAAILAYAGARRRSTGAP
jgi:uncharacterized membrane protein